jgi:sugar phosphate isomerase/epimerase
MLKLAFSSVATHDWPLDRVLDYAAQIDVDAVELRTFGCDSTRFACDPALTGEAKIHRMAGGHGIAICCIATGLAFDQRIHPPVIGRVIGDWDQPLRDAKRAISLAAQVDCPFVRVFAFQVQEQERRDKALERIVGRLKQVVDAARNTGVRVVLENGGSFQTAVDLAEIMDLVDSPLIGASYSVPVAHMAGEDPTLGVNVLGERLWIGKVKDLDGAGRPCRPGDGVVPCEAFVTTLARSGNDAWCVFEWDRAWIDGLADPENVLPESMERLMAWSNVRRSRMNRAGVS